MSDVKWIKITTDIFNDEKMLLIETLPEADSIIVIWFKLLCLAGKENNSGVFLMNDKIAYTDKMLATIFRRKESTIQLALKTFEQFGMIEIINSVITIPNWGKYQNLDQLENKKQYMRDYMREYREKQRGIACKTNGKTNSKTNCKTNVRRLDKEGEKEREGEREKKERINYQEIVNLYNETCVSFPRCVSVSDSRKKAINARLKIYTIEDFKTIFEKAEASSFLKGANGRNWSATFDWMLKDSNFAKILEGNYDDKSSKQNSTQYEDGVLLFNIDEADENPPFYGLPKQWFTEDHQLIREKVTPVKQRAIPERGLGEPVIYSVKDVLETYELRRRYFENNSERHNFGA